MQISPRRRTPARHPTHNPFAQVHPFRSMLRPNAQRHIDLQITKIRVVKIEGCPLHAKALPSYF
jgi:hypothetical protein